MSTTKMFFLIYFIIHFFVHRACAVFHTWAPHIQGEDIFILYIIVLGRFTSNQTRVKLIYILFHKQSSVNHNSKNVFIIDIAKLFYYSQQRKGYKVLMLPYVYLIFHQLYTSQARSCSTPKRTPTWATCPARCRWWGCTAWPTPTHRRRSRSWCWGTCRESLAISLGWALSIWISQCRDTCNENL